MLRYEIIQTLIDHHGYKSFLEIGIHVGNTWKRIKCDRKVGVDNDVLFMDDGILEMTSDEYFNILRQTKGHSIGMANVTETPINPQVVHPDTFDIVFIDGLHTAEQVHRDFTNAVKFLNPGGCIVFHDCNPPTEAHGAPEPSVWKTNKETGEKYFVWCGTVWQTVCEIGLDFTVDTDWGVGVIYAEDVDHNTIHLNRYPWEHFDKYRKNLLSLISVDEFKARYGVK